VELCVSQNQTNCTIDPANYGDAIVAMDLHDGHVVWSQIFAGSHGLDVWTTACFSNSNPNGACPAAPGPDFDFAQAPMLFTINVTSTANDNTTNTTTLIDVLGVGQKSGLFMVLRRDTGALVWTTYVGPGGVCGGMQWGSAIDDKRIYVAVSNCDFQFFKLNNGLWINVGFWAALDRNTGAVLWQTPDPRAAEDKARAQGPLTITAGGILFAGSEAGDMHALDASNGNILWTYSTNGKVKGGATVVNGQVYWGSGDGNLYSFALGAVSAALTATATAWLPMCCTLLIWTTLNRHPSW